MGSDELIANQIIPLQYFKERNLYGKPFDLWLKLNYLDAHEIKEQIVIETNVSLYQELELPYFADQLASKAEIKDKGRV